MSGETNGHTLESPRSVAEVRLIEIDLADLELPAALERMDELALAAAHVYERFVPYADEGWEWITFPGSRDFDGWVLSETSPRHIAAARLLSRRVALDSPTSTRPAHGVSPYRTRQLTGRPWTAEPGSKLWRSFS